MSFQTMAAALVEKVGGKENISNVIHCATRLRFTVKDESKVDVEGIKAEEGVLGLVVASGQYQVIIGPTVKDVHKATIAIVGEAGGSATEEAPKKEKLTPAGVGKVVLDTLVRVWQKILCKRNSTKSRMAL